MNTVFIVEDDDNICGLVCYALESANFRAHGFETGEKFWDAMEKERPDIVLLDIMLPGGESGLDILAKLKKKASTRDLPVIMLTAKNAEMDRVRGLDSGADDYISKPFSVVELLSRVKAVLRRCQNETIEKIEIGGISMNISQHSVFVQGQEAPLTLKEFELLRLFMKNAGIALSRERLMELIWGHDFQGESRTLDVHIKSLRKKLGTQGDCIQTIRGMGYKFDEMP